MSPSHGSIGQSHLIHSVGVQVESLDDLEQVTGGEVKSSQLGSSFISEQRGGPQPVPVVPSTPHGDAEVELATSA